jgi:hypothetical protein
VNINVSIIDQQVRGLATKLKSQIDDAMSRTLDEVHARSVAFVLLCQKTLLGVSDEEALDVLTDGGNDFGVDALDLSDVTDGEFTVTLFQGKYHHADLEGVKNVDEATVLKSVQAVRKLFDPAASLNVNPRLEARIEEVRSLIADGNIPNVRFLICSNGRGWSAEAQAIIDREHFSDRVRVEHIDHDLLIQILQSSQPIKDSLQFAGKAIVEDLNYARVFIGKVPVSELARLMDAHGDRLLERNIRRYLGLHGNRVNEAIQTTLQRPEERNNFYFYNNGLTLICERFDYNALQQENHKVRVEGLQIVNGGQTSKTIQATLREMGAALHELEQVHVLVRLYQVSSDRGAFIQTITYATNSQNPVDLKDLRSNDARQQRLELSMRDLGFEYRRQRSEAPWRSSDISTGAAAEAVLAVWRQRPQQAKYRRSEHFGTLYDTIFTHDLNAAQVVIAVLLFRIAENKRRRPPPGSADFVPYASCFAAMLMGRSLLNDLGITLGRLDHRNVDAARQRIADRGDDYFEGAIRDLARALQQLYGARNVSLQQLSATFRRGDLMQYLAPRAATAPATTPSS